MPERTAGRKDVSWVVLAFWGSPISVIQAERVTSR
jgi:hypothetical protein